MVVTNDLSEYDTFWEDLYECSCLYECLLKYVCGGISLIFVILYLIALIRIQQKKASLEFDVRDKILLSIVLGESFFILLYHIFFVHYILLFVMRVIKILEQVTIFFILIEVTTKNFNSVKAFRVALVLCALTIATMVTFIIIEMSY